MVDIIISYQLLIIPAFIALVGVTIFEAMQ